MKIKLDKGAFSPTRAHKTDAGLDIRSMESGRIFPGSSRTFHTGVHIQLPEGTCGLLVSKSGLNVEHGITSTGLIDEGYTGEIRVTLYNYGTLPYIVSAGDKITQLVIVPVMLPDIETVDELDGNTERGDRGFGSSGK